MSQTAVEARWSRRHPTPCPTHTNVLKDQALCNSDKLKQIAKIAEQFEETSQKNFFDLAYDLLIFKCACKRDYKKN